MPIPDYQTIMLPLLRYAEDKNEHSFQDAIEFICKKFDLTDEERRVKVTSGKQDLIGNRVGWALSYMKKAKLLESTRRAYFKITERGIQVLLQNPDKIDNKFLSKYPEFIEFQAAKEKPLKDDEEHLDTPEELLEEGYQKIRQNLADELLRKVKNSHPSFFESLVVDLLLNMGYGGSRKDAGESIGQAGDEGIDGIIKEDKLGLNEIYIQAKRWDNGVVGRPEIQKFVGALQGKRAKKGIFITTSKFTQEAIQYANNIDTKVVLIDGNKLSQLMIDHNVGVATVSNYEIKRVDSDYFPE
jgi:restriction system protein